MGKNEIIVLVDVSTCEHEVGVNVEAPIGQLYSSGGNHAYYFNVAFKVI